MQNEHNSFDEKIRGRVEEYSYPFESAQWEDMQRRLDAAQPVSWWKKWYNLLVAVFLLTSIASLYHLLQLPTDDLVAQPIRGHVDTLEIYQPLFNYTMAVLSNDPTSQARIKQASSIEMINNFSAINQTPIYLQASEKGNRKSPILARKARTLYQHSHSVKSALTSANNAATTTNTATSSGGAGGPAYHIISTPQSTSGVSSVVPTPNANNLQMSNIQPIQEGESNSSETVTVAVISSSKQPIYSKGTKRLDRNWLEVARFSQDIDVTRDIKNNTATPSSANHHTNTSIGNLSINISGTNDDSIANENTNTTTLSSHTLPNESMPAAPAVSTAENKYNTYIVVSYYANESNSLSAKSYNRLNQQSRSIGLQTSYQVTNKITVETGLHYVQHKYNGQNGMAIKSSAGMIDNLIQQKHWQIPLQVKYQILEYKKLDFSATAATIVRCTQTLKSVSFTQNNNIEQQTSNDNLSSTNTRENAIQTSSRELNTVVNLSFNAGLNLSKRLKFVLSPYWQQGVTGSTDVLNTNIGVKTSINFKF